MLDRALARTTANLSTLILVALVFTAPIHLIQSFMFKDALAVQEIAPEIRSFPEGRQVRGVARGDLEAERNALLIALALDLLLVPFAYRAAKRVMEVDADGGVPNAIDAWTHRAGAARPSLSAGPVLVAVAIGGLAALLALLTVNLIADMVSADLAWAMFGLGRATAAALFVALVAGTAAALPPGSAPVARAPDKLDLY
jgi:hypothetical protein